ncbi:MAG: efflux RND transporter periplasmic adaptor subunit [Chloroflexi bacterium]|nr:efflux RND transporter periplasmic adaptor subunit [Chloroflexota bacterium]MCL5110443.1 efflux RND transporter periplasmic adaptor subunit [Chloroflexota bacterium]
MSSPAPRPARPNTRRPRFFTPMRIAALMVVLVAALGVGYVSYQRVSAQPAPAVQTTTVRLGTVAVTVAASGSVVDTKQSRLSFGSSGKLNELPVNVGDSVKAGQTLATVDPAPYQTKLDQAQSALRQAQIKLDQLKASPAAVDVSAAQAAYDSAVAKLNDLAGPPSDSSLDSAQQSVDSAQAALQKAQNDLATLQAGPTQDAITIAKADLAKKQAALQQAQGEYDKVSWHPDVAMLPQALALQQATIDYQSSLASYNQTMAPPKPEDVAADQKTVESAQASLQAAESSLNELKAGAKASDLEAARSAVAQAKAALDDKTAGPTAQDVALQQEAIIVAQTNVNQAELDLANTKIVAPFDGVVAAVSGNPGEQVGAGTAVVTLVDPLAVRVDATVDETDVAKIAVGQSAQVTFDALTGQTFNGKVIALAPSGTVQQGVVSYLVSVQLDPAKQVLPAGLTANVTITVNQKDNVLVVPNRAIQVQGRSRVVEVETATGIETRQVQVGISNDQLTEITSGLQQGDKVIIPSTSTAAPRVNVGGLGGGLGGGPGGFGR